MRIESARLFADLVRLIWKLKLIDPFLCDALIDKLTVEVLKAELEKMSKEKDVSDN